MVGVMILNRHYNKLIKLPFNYKHEKLYKKENVYDIILVLNYNMEPVKKNRGSAIFIHVAKKTIIRQKDVLHRKIEINKTYRENKSKYKS